MSIDAMSIDAMSIDAQLLVRLPEPPCHAQAVLTSVSAAAVLISHDEHSTCCAHLRVKRQQLCLC